MSRKLAVVGMGTALVLAALAGPARAQVAACGGFTTSLRTSTGVPVGTVRLELVDSTVLRVTYTSASPWLLGETQLSATRSPDLFPMNSLGCPFPCQFAFSKINEDGTTSNVYDVDIEDIPPGSTLYLAARALVSPDPAGPRPPVCGPAAGGSSGGSHSGGDCDHDEHSFGKARRSGRDGAFSSKPGSRTKGRAGAESHDGRYCDEDHDHGGDGVPPCDRSQATEGSCACAKEGDGDSHDGKACRGGSGWRDSKRHAGGREAADDTRDDRCGDMKAAREKAERDRDDAIADARRKGDAAAKAKADFDQASRERSAVEKELRGAWSWSQKQACQSRLSDALKKQSRAKAAYDRAASEREEAERRSKSRCDAADEAKRREDEAVRRCPYHGDGPGDDHHGDEGHGDCDHDGHGDGEEPAACVLTAWGLGSPFACTNGAMYFACKLPDAGPPEVFTFTKQFAAPQQEVDSTGAFSLTVTNAGTDVIDQITITDPLGTGMGFQYTNPTGACSAAGQSLTCVVNGLQPGEQWAATVVYIAPSVAQDLTNCATATTRRGTAAPAACSTVSITPASGPQ